MSSCVHVDRVLGSVNPSVFGGQLPCPLLAQGHVCFSGKLGHMLQLLSAKLPPDAIDVVSSQGPGEPDTGKR